MRHQQSVLRSTQGPVEFDTPTSIPKENPPFLGSSWEPTFGVPNKFNFDENAPIGSKLGA